MMRTSVNGPWRLYFFPQGTKVVKQPSELAASGLTSVEATVPGNVELDLVAAGILPDPFVGDNIHLLRPYELYEWWYWTEFATPAGSEDLPIHLVFGGVDCHAVYWLNNEVIGTSDNMLIEHAFDVTDVVRPSGTNDLAVQLRSPLAEAMERGYSASLHAGQTNWEHLAVRKAPHSYGWDIMPRALSAGLWRGVELVVQDTPVLEELYLYTRAVRESEAELGLYFRLAIAPQELHDLELRISGTCGASQFAFTEAVRFCAGSMRFRVTEPQLWWPRGYGEANLYEIHVEVLQQGRVLTERRETIGIRTVELVRTDITTREEPGEFLFKVNDTPILCKGSNWVPTDVFHSRDASRYERMLELFYDLKCNIVRCWGGGVYEDHAFFDLCDRYGMLVWQDFSMACAAYPQDQRFLDTMAEEAASVVRKLRNHASLALWCGDNECDMIMDMAGLDPRKNRITREILHNVVYDHDPWRAYLPSSPYYAPAALDARDGDVVPEQHLWGPRDYYKSCFYTEATAHFVSEIGYHGCPNLSSIETFIEPDYLWPWQDNAQWITHCTDAVGAGGAYSYRIQLMADQIAEMFGVQPESLEEFILASQISQAEAKKFFIEMTRLRKWRRTGIIWWNMIDGWPQFSDAVVDYYFGKKLAYHYIRRVQEPFCVMIGEPQSWHVPVSAGNDSLERVEGEFRVWDADDGQTLLQGSFAVPPNANTVLGQIRVSRGEQKLFLLEWTANGQSGGNHYLLGTPPFSLERYKGWLPQLAALQPSFAAETVGQ